MKKIAIMFGLALFYAAFCWGQSDFTRGEALFIQNKPQESLPQLESAVVSDPTNVKAFLYLGIVYLQLNRIDDSIAILRRILPDAGTDASLIAYNLGNAFFAKGNGTFARQYYTQAIELDNSFASAYLNRANSHVKSGALSEAIPDYEQYISLEPLSPKRPQIESLINFIREEFAAIERRKILLEDTARIKVERQQVLLQEVTTSLRAVSADSHGLSAGAEEIIDYDNTFELE